VPITCQPIASTIDAASLVNAAGAHSPNIIGRHPRDRMLMVSRFRTPEA
jgi:hypothetical protein